MGRGRQTIYQGGKMITPRMPNEMRHAVDLVLEHLDTMVSVNLTREDYAELYKAYNDKHNAQALVIVSNAMRRLMVSFIQSTDNHELFFEDPIYWRRYTKARRMEILNSLHDYLEQMP
jgi:hypothetical protein